MPEIERHTLVVGPFQCNCSILICKKTREAIVIDAGDQFERISNKLNELGVQAKMSIHTHAHLDHIGAVKELKGASPSTKIALHPADRQIYENLPAQGQLFGLHYQTPPPVDVFVEDGQVLRFGEQEFSVLHTPGHSPGGICLHFKQGQLGDEPTVFSGDTLFHESIGRTDLWEGDHRTLLRSIKERLFVLPEETKVQPGHGPATSIAHETRNNPFL